MTFGMLAIICLVGLVGPLLAAARSWRVPVVIGELAAGVLLGRTGIGYLPVHDPTFDFLADIGFALVMFVAGSHVPIRDRSLRRALPVGVGRVLVVLLPAAAFSYALARGFGTGHAPVYAVLMASSSAALVLPIVDSLGLHGLAVVQLLPQVAIADALCIVALPLVIEPDHAARAALGALEVGLGGLALYVALRRLEDSGLRRRVHRVSERRLFAVELRVSLVALFLLAAIAVRAQVSIMLAGFAVGLAVAAVGEPRRLAKQLFALTEGFLGPVFFVWLGGTLDLRALGQHPSYIALGALLGVGALLAHLAPALRGQPAALGSLAAAQLGVPVAAATIGDRLGVLRPGESSALMLGALLTMAAATVGARRQAAVKGEAAPGGEAAAGGSDR